MLIEILKQFPLISNEKWLDDDVEYRINVLIVKPHEGQIFSQKN